MILKYLGLILGIIVVFLVLYTVVGLIKTIYLKNKEVKLLTLPNDNSDRTTLYGNELFELIKVSSPATSNDESFHIIREKIKTIFPLIHNNFYREKIDQNVIYTYKNFQSDKPNVLFVSHIDNLIFNNDAIMTNNEIYGAGTFDAKALLYVICKAVEEVLDEQGKLDVNLTIVITTDDTSTKHGSEKIAKKLLKEGKFFHLVMEEGIGIVDPDYLGLKSNYALIGIGVTGEVEIRFKKPLSEKHVLLEFLQDVKNNRLFKTKINRQIIQILKQLSKDMDFKNRFYINNILLFKHKVQKSLDSGDIKVSRIVKTNVKYGLVQENEKEVYFDMKFELAPLTMPSEVLEVLAPYIEKYNLDYEIIFVNGGSRITNVDQPGYKCVVETINKIFKHLYISPFIITNIAEKRFFDSVSDCVIRFSPLYYPSNILKDNYHGKEHIQKKSLLYVVDFFKTILKEFKVEVKSALSKM